MIMKNEKECNSWRRLVPLVNSVSQGCSKIVKVNEIKKKLRGGNKTEDEKL